MKNAIIYDFETLGQNAETAPVVSCAMLDFDESLFLENNRPSYQDYLNQVKYIKFNVGEQVQKYDRKIEKDTLNWWKKLGPEAAKELAPSPKDVSISKFRAWILENYRDPSSYKKVYTRGNTFDPIFLHHILKCVGDNDPFNWWSIRDTRSMIDGMTLGTDLSNKWIPSQYKEIFVAHDPRHDIVMDVMRMEYLTRELLL